MAYTATITKGAVSKTEGGLYNISIDMVVNDGENDVFERSFSTKYNPNAPNMNALKAELQGKIVADWDKFIAEAGIKDAAAFDSLISSLQTQANTYINQ